MNSKEKIAIVGGTGKEGKGLAYRWAKAGYEVVIGSRNFEKAQSAVNEVKDLLPADRKSNITGAENLNAVDKAEIIVLTIPYQFHKEMLNQLKPTVQGKTVVDVTVPLVPPKVSVINIPENGSVSMTTSKVLGPDVRVISAFQNISFELLLSDKEIECDVLLCGSDKLTRELGIKLVEDAGLNAWDAGPLENSIVAEGLTSVLIRLNKKYKTHSAGIKITGINKK